MSIKPYRIELLFDVGSGMYLRMNTGCYLRTKEEIKEFSDLPAEAIITENFISVDFCGRKLLALEESDIYRFELLTKPNPANMKNGNDKAIIKENHYEPTDLQIRDVYDQLTTFCRRSDFFETTFVSCIVKDLSA